MCAICATTIAMMEEDKIIDRDLYKHYTVKAVKHIHETLLEDADKLGLANDSLGEMKIILFIVHLLREHILDTSRKEDMPAFLRDMVELSEEFEKEEKKASEPPSPGKVACDSIPDNVILKAFQHHTKEGKVH